MGSANCRGSMGTDNSSFDLNRKVLVGKHYLDWSQAAGLTAEGARKNGRSGARQVLELTASDQVRMDTYLVDT